MGKFINEATVSGKIKFGSDSETKNGKKVYNAKIGFGSKEKGYKDIPIVCFDEVLTGILKEFEASKEPVTVTGFLTEERYTNKEGTKVSQVKIVVLGAEGID